MQFLYDENASSQKLLIKDENYRYLVKVRRLKSKSSLNFRNFKDNFIYHYEIESIGKKEVILTLKDKTIEKKSALSKLHILWCIIDIKTIEKTLPMLNQIGVSKISFIYCQRSQKNFKIDMSKLKKILINSCQQCGRSNLMDIEILESFDEMLKLYNNFAVLDFGGEHSFSNISSILIGCEGGFSEDERKLLKNNQKIGFKTNLIQKSETATLIIASKLLI